MSGTAQACECNGGIRVCGRNGACSDLSGPLLEFLHFSEVGVVLLRLEALRILQCLNSDDRGRTPPAGAPRPTAP